MSAPPKTEEQAIIVFNGQRFLATEDERRMLREMTRPTKPRGEPDRRHCSEFERGRTE